MRVIGGEAGPTQHTMAHIPNFKVVPHEKVE